MLDHVGIRSVQFEELVPFYEAILAPLGFSKLIATPQAASFGVDKLPSVSIVKGKAPGRGFSLALRSNDRSGVEAFYRAAMANGAISQNEPQLITRIHPDYYVAIVEDPDGNSISAVCYTKTAAKDGVLA